MRSSARFTKFSSVRTVWKNWIYGSMAWVRSVRKAMQSDKLQLRIKRTVISLRWLKISSNKGVECDKQQRYGNSDISRISSGKSSGSSSRQSHPADYGNGTAKCRWAFRVVLTVRNGVVEWVMGLGHISAADHATGGGASQIRHRPPSRMTQSRPRSEQNTCEETDWCVSHSTHPDPRKRNITIKWGQG